MSYVSRGPSIPPVPEDLISVMAAADEKWAKASIDTFLIDSRSLPKACLEEALRLENRNTPEEIEHKIDLFLNVLEKMGKENLTDTKRERLVELLVPLKYFIDSALPKSTNFNKLMTRVLDLQITLLEIVIMPTIPSSGKMTPSVSLPSASLTDTTRVDSMLNPTLSKDKKNSLKELEERTQGLTSEIQAESQSYLQDILNQNPQSRRDHFIRDLNREAEYNIIDENSSYIIPKISENPYQVLEDLKSAFLKTDDDKSWESALLGLLYQGPKVATFGQYMNRIAWDTEGEISFKDINSTINVRIHRNNEGQIERLEFSIECDFEISSNSEKFTGKASFNVLQKPDGAFEVPKEDLDISFSFPSNSPLN